MSTAASPVVALRRRRFSAADVFRMLETGILTEDDPVELLEGDLYVVSPQGPTHSALVVIIRRCLEDHFGPGYLLQDHSPVFADDHSLPEPDLAVVRGEPRDYLSRLPGPADVALVVEVAVTTKALAEKKIALYARAGFLEYWLVDVPARRITVLRDPGEAGYGNERSYGESEALAPAGTEGAIRVRDLLP